MAGEFHDEKHRGYLLVTIDGPAATIAWKAIVEAAALGRLIVGMDGE